MSTPEIQRDISKLHTQVAVASDQARRALANIETLEGKLEEKMEAIDRRIEGKLDNVGNNIHSIKNTLVRLETESKSNTKWAGWVLAAMTILGEVAFNLLSR